MKAIKIEAKNAAAIESALKAVNGKSEAHAFTTFNEILFMSEEAEDAIDRLKLPKANRAGAAWRETSGTSVPNSYKGKRNGTRVTIERRSGGWYLTEITQVELYQQGGGAGRLRVTQAQADDAVARFKAGFSVMVEGLTGAAA